jgi:hypothetical protein
MWDTTPIVSLFAGMTRLESYPTSKNHSLSASQFHDAECRATMGSPTYRCVVDPPRREKKRSVLPSAGRFLLWIASNRGKYGHRQQETVLLPDE